MSWRPAMAAIVLASALGACAGSATTATTVSTVATTEAGPTEPGAAPASPMPEADEVFDDPGEPVSVAVGESFALSLDANPSTGNTWSITETGDPKVVTSSGHQYSADPDAEGATALGGTDVWIFEAAGAGETSVTLAYGTPGAAPETTTTFRITVR